MSTTTFIIIVVGFLLLLILDRIRYQRKVKRIIEKYKDKDKDGSEVSKAKDGAPEGWGMNNSPFRRRRSGLTWGGGNVHASNADRGTRRTFMKRRE